MIQIVVGAVKAKVNKRNANVNTKIDYHTVTPISGADNKQANFRLLKEENLFTGSNRWD